MNPPPSVRQRILHYFDQSDRTHPGAFTEAGTAIKASAASETSEAGAAGAAGADVEDYDLHAAFQEIRMLAQAGQLELVGAPIGVVHGRTQVRITNAGRKVGERAADRAIRRQVLDHIATHAAERPTPIDDSPAVLQISAAETYRALIALAASGLISHQPRPHGLGLVQITARGQAVATHRRE